MATDAKAVFSSFRDPSGFLFVQDGTLYRQVNRAYREEFDLLMESGLYKRLVKEGLMVPFKEDSAKLARTGDAYKVLRPVPVPFVSYPYEWCFSQLKDAALLTLRIQKIALEHGISLKDASAYNIQFVGGKPVLIDHLSFERYEEKPWVAYRQFCQHFLAPLALAAYTDIRLTQLLRVYIEGIPLDLATRLLPAKAKLNPQLLGHLYLHARSQRALADRGENARTERDLRLGKRGLLAILNGLESGINRLSWEPKGTEWGEYYDQTNYTKAAFNHKVRIVEKFIRKVKPETVWDLGANTGRFSRIAAGRAKLVVSLDVDPAAVERNYLEVKESGEERILPLVMDFANPSGGVGWANQERMSLIDRGSADCAMPLALIHHLAISNNLPFSKIAEFFAGIARSLIIEFVPKEDSQVQRLLATREDIFPDYNEEGFEREFEKLFTIMAKVPVRGSKRTIYLMERER